MSQMPRTKCQATGNDYVNYLKASSTSVSSHEPRTEADTTLSNSGSSAPQSFFGEKSFPLDIEFMLYKFNTAAAEPLSHHS